MRVRALAQPHTKHICRIHGKSAQRGRTNLQATRSWQDMRCMQCPQTPPCTCPSRTPCTCRRCCPCTRRCTCSLRSRRFLHYTHVHKCRHTHASENLSMCMCACVCVCMHICAYACVYVYACPCTCLCACIFTYFVAITQGNARWHTNTPVLSGSTCTACVHVCPYV